MKSVVIYSGGMDSFTLIHYVVQRTLDKRDVSALSFDYGQRHSKEIGLAAFVAKSLGITHRIVNLSELGEVLGGGSSLVTPGRAVPEGHYEDVSMRQTVVPNRNMIMLSIAAGHAIAIGASGVFYGAHAGDHAIYPDCRAEFVDAVEAAVRVGNYEAPNLYAPFLDMAKGGILQLGKELGLEADDYAFTWTCYNGRTKACGKCGACQERLEAFAEVGWQDPVEYE